ncbi:AMP-binding protein [Streptomyces luteireticuli]|uniref:AMP-binding protein n=1 Tax=Streptomyces luteireticuli TaxID=173858 RepID=A0ABP3I8W2_9ACTN
MVLHRMARSGIRLGTLVERAAARHPANVLVLDHDLDVAPHLGRRTTVAEVADLVADLASRLWAAGVRPGDRVVVHKSNSLDITLLAFAAARAGAVPVLLSAQLDGDTVLRLLRRAERPFLVTDQDKLDRELPPPVFEEAEEVLVVRGSYPRAIGLESLAGAERIAPVATAPHRPALITHTSGTTGVPKLAVHTGVTQQIRYLLQVSALAPVVPRRETIAIHASFVHSRMISVLAIALLRGLPMLVLADEDPERAAEHFARMRPGIVEAHPNSFMAWEAMADDPRRPLANVKLFSSTFDALHPRTVHRMLGASRRRAPLFGQMYGQTETGPVVCRGFTRRRSRSADGRCVGFPFVGTTAVRVVGRDGRPPSARTPGFIEVRSKGHFVTYLGEQERHDGQLSADGWWRTGDVGYRTRWGCVHLLDREVDVIEEFGSTLDAEDRLLTGVTDLTEVVIVRGADGLAVPVVCTKDDRPLDEAAWRAAAAALPPMAPPVHWREDELPKTATMKIKRFELARILAERQSDAA